MYNMGLYDSYESGIQSREYNAGLYDNYESRTYPFSIRHILVHGCISNHVPSIRHYLHYRMHAYPLYKDNNHLNMKIYYLFTSYFVQYMYTHITIEYTKYMTTYIL